MIDLTIVIVSHQTRDLLSACLDAVGRAQAAAPALRIETIVVDNGSTDGSVEVALASAVEPRILALVRNRGFAAAVNRALMLRRGRHVLLLNTDAEIDASLLGSGVRLLDETPAVGALGVALRHPDGRPQRSIHLLPSLQTESLPEPLLRLLNRRAFGPAERRGLAVAHDATFEVEAVRGAVFFVRGESLEKVGLFDEGYFFFLEETDYCDRLRAAGLRILYAGNLHATHLLGASSKRRAPLATRIEYHRSLYRYLSRRHGRAAALASRAIRVLRSGISCLALWPVSKVSHAARERLAERSGLVLWHLRGCPPEPDLASALRRAVESGRAAAA